MATLAGKKIKLTYGDVLHVSNANSGIDGTIRTIEDGKGTSSVLGLSTAAVAINGIVYPTSDGTSGQVIVTDGAGNLSFSDVSVTEEAIQDIAGAMWTGNTETGCTVTYQDADGTIDIVISDLTVAGDTGSTGMTPGDTLTIAGSGSITTAMSGDTLTISSSGIAWSSPVDANIVPDTDSAYVLGSASRYFSGAYIDSIIASASITSPVITASSTLTVTSTILAAGGSTTITGTMIVSGVVDFNTTESIKIPVGTTAQRPSSPTDGDLRVNSSTGTTEVYRSSAWRDLEAGGGSDTFAAIEVDGVGVSTAAPTLDFDGTDFALTESPTDSFDITINAERIQDIAGAMWTGNTETGCTVTYQDADGTIDIAVTDTTVAGDTGSTGITPGDTLTIAGGTNATTVMSGDTLTINVDDAFLSNSGDVGTGVYDFGGATSFEIPNGTTPTTDAAGEIAMDTNGNGSTVTTGVIQGFDGTQNLYFFGATNYPSTDNDVMVYDSATNAVKWEAQSGAGGGISNVVEDTTPQLGGQLDVNGNAIGDGTRELITFTEDASAVNHINIENEATGSGPIIRAAGDDTNIDLNVAAKGSGNIAIGNFVFDADQTVGAGQDNYVLTYDNSGGLISLEAAAGGGGGDWTLISSATASGSATISFTGLTSDYMAYAVIFQGVQPATDDTGLLLRTSTDNGSTYDSGAGNYWWSVQGRQHQGTTGSAGNGSDTDIALCAYGSGIGVGNATNEQISGIMFLYRPSSATTYTQVSGHCIWTNTVPRLTVGNFAGERLSTGDVDAIQFFMSSGNMDVGEFRLYGISNA